LSFRAAFDGMTLVAAVLVQGLAGGCTCENGVCGDGTRQDGEACDGADVPASACLQAGFAGAAGCRADCTLDLASCGSCGDGVAKGAEACDGADLRGASCETLGYDAGELRCTACTLDAALCSLCGNGVQEVQEECDGADLGGETCLSQGLPGAGALACTGQCLLDRSGCVGLNPFALYFDGVDDVVDCGPLDLGLPYSEYAIEAWVRLVDASPGTILDKWTDDCAVAPDRSIRLAAANGSVTTMTSWCSGCGCTSQLSLSVPAGAWHHVAYVKFPECVTEVSADGLTASGCLPAGDLLLSDTYDSPCASPSESAVVTSSWPVLIGRDNCGTGTCLALHGYVDELRIWNYARDRYNLFRDFCGEQLAGDEPGLVAYWRFNEGSGDVTIEEVSGTPCRLGSADGPDTEDPTWVADTPF